MKASDSYLLRPVKKVIASKARDGRIFIWESGEKYPIAIKRINPSDGEIRIFHSLYSAGKCGHNQSAISKCLRGLLKTHHGYIWEKVHEEV